MTTHARAGGGELSADNSVSLAEAAGWRQGKVGWGLAVLIAIVTFVGIAPTLTMLEFSSGSENLNVGTVLEMRRGGPWIIPKLKGLARTTKPPLTAWVSAWLVPEASVKALSVSDRVQREAAYQSLAWRIRWPALALCCLMLLATFDLGKTLGDTRIGVIATVVCGSNLLFLHFARSATTDVHLALWVTVGSALLARAVVLRQAWVGFIGAGLAMGLALMSKGPVALVQCAVPVGAWCLWRGWVSRGNASRRESQELPDPARTSPSRRVLPLLLGSLVMLAVFLPWPIYVLWKYDNMLRFWWTEITRAGATNLSPDPIYSYLTIFARMLPWTVFFIAGSLMAVGLDKRRDPRRVLALLLCFLPIVIMSLFKDKNDRYLLPMIAPASVLCAYALAEQFKPRAARQKADDVVLRLHWAAVTVIAIGFPIAGAIRQTGLLKIDGSAWFTPAQAGLLAIGPLLLLILGVLRCRQHPAIIVIAPFVIMLTLQIGFIQAYRQTYEGRSEMKPLTDVLWAKYPQAVIVYDPGRKNPKPEPVDLNIYSNRVARAFSDAEMSRDRLHAIVVPQRLGNRPEPNPEPYPGTSDHHVFRAAKHDWHLFIVP